AEHVLGWNFDVLEDQRPRVRGSPAELVFLLARTESRHSPDRVVVADPKLHDLVEIARLLGDDEGADSLRSGAGLGHRRYDENLAHAAVGNEDLAAVQDVEIPFPNRG